MIVLRFEVDCGGGAGTSNRIQWLATKVASLRAARNVFAAFRIDGMMLLSDHLAFFVPTRRNILSISAGTKGRRSR
jgi:hypothetical protein